MSLMFVAAMLAFAGNVSALAEGQELPFMKAVGEVSERGGRAPQRTADPRDHA